MGKEIEHKYLVKSNYFKTQASERHVIVQGYLSKDPERIVRVRIYDSKAFLTIKGKNIGDTRFEYEYDIPVEDANSMLNLCIGNVIKKVRWIVFYDGFKWEIDEFLNRDIPTIAEIELAESSHNYPVPSFIGEEVTGDERYYNSNL